MLFLFNFFSHIEKSNFTYHLIHIFRKVLEGVGNFFQEVSDSKRVPSKSAKLFHTAAQGCSGKLRKADAKLSGFGILVKNEGFRQFLRCKPNGLLRVCGGNILLCHRRNGGRIGIENADDLANANILIVSYV